MENTITDKILICKDCHRKFYFTVKEQKDYGQKGWEDPVRCLYCRRQKKILNLALKDGVNMSDEVRFQKVATNAVGLFTPKLKDELA